MDHEEGQPPHRELHLLRGLESAIHPAALGLDHRRLVHRARHLRVPRQEPRAQALLARDFRRGEHRVHRLLQVRRIPAAELAGADGLVRHHLGRARVGHRPARRHLLLYVRDAVLHAGRLPRATEADPVVPRLRAFRDLLPAPGRRPDRAPDAARAPVRDAAAGDARPDAVGPQPHRARALHESRPCRCRARERRRSCVRCDERGRLRGRLARDARILGPDFLRLRGLLDGRRGRLALPRFRAARQLPHALRGDRLLGFLASLAYLAVDVAARLSLHSARRQPRQRSCAPTST